MRVLPKELLDPTDWIAWPAYDAGLQQTVKPDVIIALLPLFTNMIQTQFKRGTKSSVAHSGYRRCFS